MEDITFRIYQYRWTGNRCMTLMWNASNVKSNDLKLPKFNVVCFKKKNNSIYWKRIDFIYNEEENKEKEKNGMTQKNISNFV